MKFFSDFLGVFQDIFGIFGEFFSVSASDFSGGDPGILGYASVPMGSIL